MPTPLIQPSFAAGELAPALWARVDLAKFHVGLKTARNFLISATGGAYNRAGTQFVGEVRDSRYAARLIPFQFSTQQTYVLEFGHLCMRVIKDGGYVQNGSGGIYEIPTPYIADDLPLLKFAQSADVLTLTHPAYAPCDLSRTGHAAWTLTEVSFGSAIAPPSDVTATAHHEFGDLGTSNEYAKTWKYVVTAQDAAGNESRASVVAGASNYQALGRQDASDGTSKYNWNDVAWTQVPGAVKYHVYKDNAGLRGWIGSTDGLTFRDDNIEADTTISPLEGRDPFHAPRGITGVTVTATGSGYSDATVLTVLDPAGSGCVLTPVVAEGKLVSVTVESPGSGYISPTVQASVGLGAVFSVTVESAANWPGAVTYFEQRKIWAGGSAHPQTLWTSRSGDYRSMDVSAPSQDDDAITRTIAAQQVHEIRHLVPLQTLLLLTSGGEWKCWAGSSKDVLTPSSMVLRQQSANGSSHVPPVVVNGTVLYTLGSSVRSLGYDWSQDTYTGTDLMVLSSHLLRGRSVVSWAWAAEPDKVVWVVRDDGALLSLTYMKEQDVYAWCRHDTAGGAFESVAVVREGTEDAVYFVVRRTDQYGATKRYVERLHSRQFDDVASCFFVDCGLSYYGAPSATFAGLDHLEGKTVAILGDGNVFPPQVVAGGKVKLAQAVSKARIGLPIVADLETLNPEPGQGTIQGKRKRVTAVTLRVEKTRGLKVGPDADHLTEIKERRSQPYGTPIELQTGDERVNIGTSWNREGSVFVRQDNPLPVTILAVVPEIDVGN